MGWPHAFGGEIQKPFIYFVHRCLSVLCSYECGSDFAVHVWVIASRQSRTVEERTELHSGFADFAWAELARY